MDTILVVEDEPKLAEVLLEYLQQSGFATHWIARGDEVMDWVKAESPDLVILDLMLPGKDGIEIFRELRQFAPIPVIMATAKVDEIDRLIGLELGADDYVCKPYGPRELVARVKNILRRALMSPQEIKAQSGVETDPERMEAKLDGEVLNLTPVEFRLLHHLSGNPGKVYTRAQLLNFVYDDHRVVTDRAIDSHVKNLRRKMEESQPECNAIQSIYGMGYKFDY
uniref:Two-component system, OmpR family, response regulator BaeR n=1 Tax=uncultured Thiotrichaceae bacterium TaxID=298394 RepID=A0A6S6U1G5_9GAMM|nr:MAG: Two-component system, OmpR family, response regulator BaeR [uncultured Thiotrichaceae bacterium]